MAESNLPTGSAQDSIVSMLDKVGSGVSNEDIKQALSPTIQRAPVQMPSYYTQPRKQPQGPAQLNERPVVGAGNARGRDIGNSVSASVRTLGNFIAMRDQRKQMAEATRVQQLLSAQSGVDQAQQVLQMDPQNAAAKESLKHNQTIVQGMFQDPKFVKSIQKGFDINLTDPSQNKTEHHSIVQKGIDLFKKQSQQPFSQDQAKQMSEKWQGQLPTQLAPNQFAMQKLQMAMTQQKENYQLMRSIMPAIIRAEGAEKVAGMRDAQALLQQSAKMHEWDRQNAIKQAQLYARLGVQQKMAFQRLDHENSNIIARENTRMKEESKDPEKLFKALDSSGREWASAISSQQTALDISKQQLNALKANAKPGDPNVAAAEADITMRENEIRRSRQFADYAKGVYQVKAKQAGLAPLPEIKDETNATADKPDESGDSININDFDAWSDLEADEQPK